MEWADIKGYEGLYKINKDGQILSLKSKYKASDRIIKNYISSKGYIVTYLTKNNKTKTVKVHILLAETFIPNPNNYPCVLHLDDIKLNISLSNLAWGTQSQNIKMSFANGHSNQSGFKNNAGKIKDFQTLLQIKSEWNLNPKNQFALAKKYNVSQATISNIITGKSYGLIPAGLAIDKTTLT